VIDVQGGAARPVSAGGCHLGRFHPTWSPDGKWLTYAQLTPHHPATDDTSNGCPALHARVELFVIDADGTKPRLLTTAGSCKAAPDRQAINSAFDAEAPDWSPAGRVIALWSGQEACSGQIWRINADGTRRMDLTQAPVPARNDDPVWSPDGRQILFSTDRRGQIHLWVMDADGGNPRFVAESPPEPGPGDAAWQPIRR
jgi:Tol biopolymer transport system component